MFSIFLHTVNRLEAEKRKAAYNEILERQKLLEKAENEKAWKNFLDNYEAKIEDAALQGKYRIDIYTLVKYDIPENVSLSGCLAPDVHVVNLRGAGKRIFEYCHKLNLNPILRWDRIVEEYDIKLLLFSD